MKKLEELKVLMLEKMSTMRNKLENMKSNKPAMIIIASCTILLIIGIVACAGIIRNNASAADKESTPVLMETLVPAETKTETTEPSEMDETMVQDETTAPDEITEPETDPNTEVSAPSEKSENTSASNSTSGNSSGTASNSVNKPAAPAKPDTNSSVPATKPITPNKPNNEPTVPTTQPEVTNPPATEPEETEPPAPTECPHNWTTINHPEEGHRQGWCVCDCGQRFKTSNEWADHVESIIAGPNPTDALLYHSGWNDDSEWIVDKPAWSETVCSICGAHK